MKFTITATINVDVVATIEAEDAEDAKRILGDADVTVESCDTEIAFNACCQVKCEVDGVTYDAEKKWNDLTKFEKMEMLKGNGVSDEAAWVTAGYDFDQVPDEWKGYFE